MYGAGGGGGGGGRRRRGRTSRRGYGGVKSDRQKDEKHINEVVILQVT